LELSNRFEEINDPQNSSGIARSRHMLFFFWTVPDDEMDGILTLRPNKRMTEKCGIQE
jgi:hypothetical protein